MRIFSWNVNGIRAVIRKGFTDWLQKEKPDVVCIQETKIQNNQLTQAISDLQVISLIFFCRKKGYSGVAIYSKKKPTKIVHGFGVEKFDMEGRVIQAYFDNLVVISTYFPNGKRDEDRLQYKYDFYADYLPYLVKLTQSGLDVVVCGDYNTAHKEIDLARPKENKKISGFLPLEREWLDKYEKAGFIDTFRYLHPDKVQYSWWSHFARSRERNVGWRIDYNFASTSLSSRIKQAKIYDQVTGSDHCPIMVEIEEK